MGSLCDTATIGGWCGRDGTIRHDHVARAAERVAAGAPERGVLAGGGGGRDCGRGKSVCSQKTLNAPANRQVAIVFDSTLLFHGCRGTRVAGVGVSAVLASVLIACRRGALIRACVPAWPPIALSAR